MPRMKLAEMVEDFAIYPRHAVDSSHVADIERAIRAGITLPPIVVDKKSKRVIDGFHRKRAYVRVLGADGDVSVELKEYANEAELLKDAVSRNAAHGRKFDQQDRTRSALMLERAGVKMQEIAVVLHTTEARVDELLTVRVVAVQDGGKVEKVPAKPIMYGRVGEPVRTINVRQYETMQSSGGHKPLQTVRQLIREIDADLLDYSDEALVELLWGLHDTLAAKLPKRVAA